MTIRDMEGGAEDKIPVRTVLASVTDKGGLDILVPELVKASHGVRFLSTGGTYKAIDKILSDNHLDTRCLTEVADYTGFPEMQGGLVKTLHPKIHAGLLGERKNPAHQKYLAETLQGGVFIDLVVVNLYQFQKVSAEGGTFEQARGNIDIGGPTMIRAAAKNFPSCAVLCDPADYSKFLEQVRGNDGCTNFDQRLLLARKAFAVTSEYETAISKYMTGHAIGKADEIRAAYGLGEKG